MTKLTIHHIIGQASIQDFGRPGFAHLGITESGALDIGSMRSANALACNLYEEAVLELSQVGITFSVDCEISIAITGARTNVYVNDLIATQNQSIALNPGDRVKIEPSRLGARVYVAFSGGLQTISAFNSQSTCRREGLGLTLKKGIHLQLKAPTTAPPQRLRSDQIPVINRTIRLGLVMGYQHYLLNWKQKAHFFSSSYKVTALADRMGYRLHTDSPIKPPIDGIRSEGVALGSLQLASDGQPIIMLNDHQTLGGYMKLGAICSADLRLLSQATTGTEIIFYPISVELAQRRLRYMAQQAPIITAIV